MSTSDDVPDSTDWLSTPLSGFAAVEAALRCQVCKDLYKTPMITSCSHTFCSLCIRRALSNDGKCPLCRATEQELKLRSNWSMEETVDAFAKVREAALSLARNGGLAHRSPKRKAESSTILETNAPPEPKRLRTSARLNKNYHVEATVTIPVEEEVVQESDDEYVPDAADGLVPCPSCQKKMKDWQVFGHLESCPGPKTNQATTDANTASFGLGQSQRKQHKTLERLPPLNYSMLKEQALRKKMAELGLSNQGPRILLERRHKEWLTLWNANCDAAVPKKRSELLHDLDVWERTQGGRAPTSGRVVQNAALIKDKDFDGAAWAAKHDTSFKDLIANARKSRLEAKKKAGEGDESISGGPRISSETQKPKESGEPVLLQDTESLAVADLPTRASRPELDPTTSGALETTQVPPAVLPAEISNRKPLHGIDAESIPWEAMARQEETALYQQRHQA